MKVFLTGPCAAPYAREFLSNMAATLRRLGHDVYVPHEASWQPTAEPWKEDRSVLTEAYEALGEAGVMVAVLDGYSVDDAVAVHLGAFYALSRQGDRPRKILGVLHDTRVAGWDWTGQDRALTPHIRALIRELGAIYPNFTAALPALDSAEPSQVRV